MRCTCGRDWTDDNCPQHGSNEPGREGLRKRILSRLEAKETDERTIEYRNGYDDAMAEAIRIVKMTG